MTSLNSADRYIIRQFKNSLLVIILLGLVAIGSYFVSIRHPIAVKVLGISTSSQK